MDFSNCNSHRLSKTWIRTLNSNIFLLDYRYDFSSQNTTFKCIFTETESNIENIESKIVVYHALKYGRRVNVGLKEKPCPVRYIGDTPIYTLENH